MVGLPPDYYERIYDVELTHWWHRGMRSISAALLGERLSSRPDLLDAGCGTGGFLRWASRVGSVGRLCGVDLAGQALGLARRRLPSAELRLAPVRALPFEDRSFDLAVANDVVQHIREQEVGPSLAELRRVMRPHGTLLLRTGGARHARRERADWRVYDREGLKATVEAVGFRCERITYANMLPSLLASARGRAVRAPTEHSHGIPPPASPAVNALGSCLLGAEARYLRRPSRSLPFGHSLLMLARP